MKYLTLNDILFIHEKLISIFGGTNEIRDIGLIESAINQPKMTFNEKELYPTIFEKAGILGYCLIKNHAFVDGNKRIGHAAMEIFLLFNGYEIIDAVNNQEKIIISVAAGKLSKDDLINWLKIKVKKK